MKITLPLRLFPEGLNEQHQLVADYFSGKEFRLSFSEDSVHIELEWPQSHIHYVDPNLQLGLNWWEKNLSINDLPLVIKQKAHYQLSLNDNWTLYAWANWLEQKKIKGQTIEKVIILHIDDHRDCMPPLLFLQNEGTYIDPLTDKQVDIEQPESIASAIISGAIAVGSFMPVLFHHVKDIEFRHLLPEHRTPAAYKAGGIENIFEKDSLLCGECDRPALLFASKVQTNHVYRPTSDIKAFLGEIPSGIPLLLHVDMDYFNNRFDGDSDWQFHDFIHDPSKARVEAKVSDVFAQVLSTVPKEQLEDVTIALSPGFFPAEFWQDSIAIIDQQFQGKYE